MKTILITGGTGLIGSAVTKALIARGFGVRHLSRNPVSTDRVESFHWSPSGGTIDVNALNGIFGIIHLAGAPIVDKAWSAERIKVLNESRSGAARLLLQSVKQSGTELDFFISAAGANYHGAISTETILDENSPAGNDIISNISIQWELNADIFNGLCRVVKLRTPLVLTALGGALPKLVFPVKLGLGAPLGSGDQWVPWVHIDDLVQAYLIAVENKDVQGVYHVSAPDHVTNREFMKTAAKALGRPFWLPPVPAFLLRMVLGKRADLLLQGSRIAGRRITDAGLHWKYPNLESALITELDQ